MGAGENCPVKTSVNDKTNMKNIQLSSARLRAPVAAVTRENTEWVEFVWSQANDRQASRVLLIGDSICSGYGKVAERTVAKQLAGKAVVDRLSTSFTISDPVFLEQVRMVMSPYRYRVIHFNNGVHGLEIIDEKVYGRRLPELVKLLRHLAPRSKLIWASSTPVTVASRPELFHPDLNDRVIERNRIAAEIMRREGIPINDLYRLVAGKPELRGGDQWHMNLQGMQILADAVTRTIARALRQISRHA